MSQVVLAFYKKFAYVALIFWTFMFMLCFVNWMYKFNVPADVFAYATICFIVFMSQAQLVASKVISFLRIHLKSVLSFWKSYLLLILGILFINVFFFLLLQGAFPEQFKNPFRFEIWDVMGIMICAVLVLFSADGFMNPVNQVKAMTKPITLIAKLVIIYVLVGVATALCMFVPVAGYFFISIVAWILFIYKNQYFASSFHKPLARKIAIYGVLVLTVIFSFTGFLAYVNVNDVRSHYLGKLGPDVTYSLSERFSINTIEDFYKWADTENEKDDFEEIQKALLKLSKLCPPEPSDSPTEILCTGNMRHTTSLRMRVLTAEEILQLLSAEDYYLNLVGIMKSRQLPLPVSEILKTTIEAFAKRPGNLSPVAMKTLAREEAEKRVRISLKIREKNIL